MKIVNFLCRLVMAADNTESKIVRLIEEDPQGWTYHSNSAMRHAKTKLYVFAYLSYRYLEVKLEDNNGAIYTPSKGEAKLIYDAARKAIEANHIIERRAAKKRMETALSEALAKAGL